MKLLKVQWKDGDVITEQHLRGQDASQEGMLALLATQMGGHGLLRSYENSSSLNNAANIVIESLQGSQYRVTIENFLGITGKGRFVSLLARRRFDLSLRTTERDPEGFHLLYMVPVEDEVAPASENASPSAGPVLYEPYCRLQASDQSHDGLCIARFKADGAVITPDSGFLPLCVTINASQDSIDRFSRISQDCLRLTDSIEQYIKALVNRGGLEPVYVFSVELFRLLSRNRTVFTDTTQNSQAYFFAAQQFFDAVAGELKILSSEYKESKLLTEAHKVIDHLSRPFLAVSLDMNMGKTYELVHDALERLLQLLSRFPEGPSVEAALPVKDMVFSKGTAYNKLVIHFVEEVSYSRDNSKLVMKLRDYAVRDPSAWNIRLALGGDMPYGSLPELDNMLTRTSTEEHDFRIECLGNVLGTGTMRRMTVYLPPPLGENVDSHKSRVSISLVS